MKTINKSKELINKKKTKFKKLSVNKKLVIYKIFQELYEMTIVK